MKIAYFNCPSGISGDMMLSALINSGVKAQVLESLLKKHLKIKDWKIVNKDVRQGHITATQTIISGDRKFKSPEEIRNIIIKSTLPSEVKEKSTKILDVLVSAEAKIHGTPKNKVHFHELNSLDTIIDITGNVLGLYLLKVDRVVSSAVNIGNPAPATIEILKKQGQKVKVYSNTSQYELATPTGIAIISTLADSFGELPEVSVEGYGFGAGLYKIPGYPDLLKVIICNQANVTKHPGIIQDRVVRLETNIDDMDPRVYPYLVKKLFDNSALDAWFENISMKKGRPGILFTVLCKPEDEKKIVNMIFHETTTIGIRRQVVERHKLQRYEKGEYKTAILPGGKEKHTVEFEKALKKNNSKPLYELLKK